VRKLIPFGPIKLAYTANRPDGWLELTASTFNRLDQYTSSPGHKAYCYAELAISSLEKPQRVKG